MIPTTILRNSKVSLNHWTHSLRVVDERILVVVTVSDIDQVLNAVLLFLGFASLQ